MENFEDIKNIDNKDQEKINPVLQYARELKAKRDKERGFVATDNSRPDFLLPQFKNIEEQAKSYKELQALQTKQAQELAKYKNTDNINAQKNLAQKQLSMLQKQADFENTTLNDIYAKELENLQMAVRLGKMSKFEAMKCMNDLESFVLQSMQDSNSKYKSACSKCGQPLNMVSPKEFFQEDLSARNYLNPICDFLENNYRQMPKSELESVKNLVNNLENSLRAEILNEKKLSQDNELYRQSLTSTANLNPNNVTEKIYTMEEIKKMKPEDFRKNQRSILEQFVAHKIK